MLVLTENVQTECERLDSNAAQAVRSIHQSFDALQSLITKRKEEVLNLVEAVCHEKRRVFNDQLELINTEKGKVEKDCEGGSQSRIDSYIVIYGSVDMAYISAISIRSEVRVNCRSGDLDVTVSFPWSLKRRAQ